MALLIAGIDEAGYGPTLGPLCVAMAVFRVDDWAPGEEAPDLWKRLAHAVTNQPGDRRGRLAIADSKRLKLANSVQRKHPLVHLERGVLACLRAAGREVASDLELLAAMGADLPSAPWYAGGAIDLPLGSTIGQIAVASGAVGAAMDRARVELVDLRCVIVPEEEFNEIVRRTRSKAEATAGAVGLHLRHLASTGPWAAAAHRRIVCDRLGGREFYADLLERHGAGSRVRALEETPARSRYDVELGEGPEGEGRAIVQFQPEAEAAHLPVALASMAAKLVRELAMARFNRYWGQRRPGLRPTAGYAQDARRWLGEAGAVLSAAERRALVRIA